MSTRILALDPGLTTGFALIDLSGSGKTLTVLDYGVVPIVRAGQAGFVGSLHEWLERYVVWWDLRGSGCDIVFEEGLPCYRLPTRKEATEARGVIRAWCELHKPVDHFGYLPNEVRSQLSLPTRGPVKTAAATFVARALGFRPIGPDHVTDAFAIALAHALRQNYWRPHLGWNANIEVVRAAKKRRKVSPAIDAGRMSTQQALRLLDSGKARVVTRR
jgi:Holliday junction resolvasome RuvABC endonuclease subunit